MFPGLDNADVNVVDRIQGRCKTSDPSRLIIRSQCRPARKGRHDQGGGPKPTTLLVKSDGFGCSDPRTARIGKVIEFPLGVSRATMMEDFQDERFTTARETECRTFDSASQRSDFS
jgi:hypothetical protein